MIQKTKQSGQPQPRRPIVAIPCDIKLVGAHPFHAVGEKYIAAVNDAADCLPFLVPVLPEPLALEEIFRVADGVFLPGSVSNVHPGHYGGTPSREGTLHDEQRDALSLPLITQTIARGLPLFAVCRGFQELNVALGGTLHQHIHEEPSEAGFLPRFDHRENKEAPVDVQYGPAHPVFVAQDSFLERLTGKAEFMVNSLHGQGLARLSPRLAVEARAADGTVEAVNVKDAPAFAYGVQWHPEWKFWENEISQTLFRAFGDAVRAHAARREKQEREDQVTHA